MRAHSRTSCLLLPEFGCTLQRQAVVHFCFFFNLLNCVPQSGGKFGTSTLGCKVKINIALWNLPVLLHKGLSVPTPAGESQKHRLNQNIIKPLVRGEICSHWTELLSELTRRQNSSLFPGSHSRNKNCPISKRLHILSE